jgi:hypothetical protein
MHDELMMLITVDSTLLACSCLPHEHAQQDHSQCIASNNVHPVFMRPSGKIPSPSAGEH